MNKFDELLVNIQATDNSTPLITIICFILTAICAMALKHVYENRSTSLSSKYQLSNIIPILSITTYLVILIVKSSLALSQGLVGALSIVRFRTPIKEPEDLVYLFLAIAIGIGFGAFQIFSTLIIFILIILFIWFRNYKNFDVKSDYNLEIFFTNNEYYKNHSEEILKVLKENTENIEFIRQDRDDKGKIDLSLRIRFNKFSNLKEITNQLNKFSKEEMSFSIYETKILF